MDNCKQCNATLTHVEGRKKKSFCDLNCKAKFYYEAKKEPKYVHKSTFEKVKAERDMYLAKLKRENPAVSGRMIDINKISASVDVSAPETIDEKVNNVIKSLVRSDNDAILAQIKAIEEEKIPAERNTTLGKKVWANDQRKRIEELKKLLN